MARPLARVLIAVVVVVVVLLLWLLPAAAVGSTVSGSEVQGQDLWCSPS